VQALFGELIIQDIYQDTWFPADPSDPRDPWDPWGPWETQRTHGTHWPHGSQGAYRTHGTHRAHGTHSPQGSHGIHGSQTHVARGSHSSQGHHGTWRGYIFAHPRCAHERASQFSRVPGKLENCTVRLGSVLCSSAICFEVTHHGQDVPRRSGGEGAL